MSSTIIKGVVRGKTIELERAPGLPDGESVTVAIQRTAGAAGPRGPFPTVESWCQRIVFDSTVSATEKVVKGTRLTAEALVAELQQGRSDEELVATHPELTPQDLAALRSYAQTPVGLRQAFGGWADDAEELDQYLEWTRQNRQSRRREIEE
jgi:uncharacterized protein (DUF433 family)